MFLRCPQGKSKKLSFDPNEREAKNGKCVNTRKMPSGISDIERVFVVKNVDSKKKTYHNEIEHRYNLLLDEKSPT